jgi:hypothetical protein
VGSGYSRWEVGASLAHTLTACVAGCRSIPSEQHVFDLRDTCRLRVSPRSFADRLQIAGPNLPCDRPSWPLDLVALGVCPSGSATDRGVPRGDGQGEEALASLRNGEPQLGDLVAGRHPALHQIGRHGALEDHHAHLPVLAPRVVASPFAVSSSRNVCTELPPVPLRHWLRMWRCKRRHPWQSHGRPRTPPRMTDIDARVPREKQ